MSNIKNQSFDDLIDNWGSSFEQEPQISENELETLVDKYEKEQKVSRIITPIRHGLLVILCISMTVFSPNRIGAILMLLMVLPILYFANRDIRFKRELDKQNRATTVVEFVNRRKQILIEGASYLKKGRYFVYPFSIAAAVNNIIAYFGNESITWTIFTILFSIGMVVLITTYLERSIREFERKLNSLK